MPLFVTRSEVKPRSAAFGSVTSVRAPGATEKLLEKLRPGILTCPVVGESPLIRRLSSASGLEMPRLAGNVSQNSVPLESGTTTPFASTASLRIWVSASGNAVIEDPRPR